MSASERILVIKLGALGDFVQALGPFAAIRRHHPRARITLLTTAPFVALAEASPYFDEVWVDARAPLWRVPTWWALRRRLRAARFSFVYDLQTSDRSGFYHRFFVGARAAGWSGIAPGASHRHDNPARDAMHTLDRQAEQLAIAGIAEVPPADISWLKADAARFGLSPPYVLLVPGGAPHRPEKRWPVERFGDLALRLAERGVTPIVIGTAAERELAAALQARCPRARDLTGATSLADIAALARAAAGAVGNDTGPMHLIAATGCPCVVLFGPASEPALCAPRGEAVAILREAELAALAPEAVLAQLRLRSEPAAIVPSA